MSESISIEEWNALSIKGEACGVFGCPDDPLWECPNCNHFYCLGHRGMHIMACSEKPS